MTSENYYPDAFQLPLKHLSLSFQYFHYEPCRIYPESLVQFFLLSLKPFPLKPLPMGLFPLCILLLNQANLKYP